MAGIPSVGEAIAAQKAKAPTGGGVADLQAITQDDNSTKTPQANAADIDILAFNLMTAVQMMAQIADEIVKLRADIETLKGGAPAPVETPTPTV